MKTKNLEPAPIESLPGYTVDDSLDPGQAELTTYIPGQDSPITVRGDAELLREDFQRLAVLEAAQATRKVRTSKVAATAVKAATAAPEAPRVLYHEPSQRERIAQYFKDAKLRRFDRTWDTNLYGKKLDKRRKMAIFLMASEEQLFDTMSDSYKAQLNRLAKGRPMA